MILSRNIYIHCSNIKGKVIPQYQKKNRNLLNIFRLYETKLYSRLLNFVFFDFVYYKSYQNNYRLFKKNKHRPTFILFICYFHGICIIRNSLSVCNHNFSCYVCIYTLALAICYYHLLTWQLSRDTIVYCILLRRHSI